MPSFSSKVQLSNMATGSNIVLADVDRIKGAFKVYTSNMYLIATSVNYYSDGQIVYVSDSGSLFKEVQLQQTHQGSFVDTIAFTEFSFNSGSFVSASFDGVKMLTFFEDVDGSTQNFNVC